MRAGVCRLSELFRRVCRVLRLLRSTRFPGASATSMPRRQEMAPRSSLQSVMCRCPGVPFEGLTRLNVPAQGRCTSPNPPTTQHAPRVGHLERCRSNPLFTPSIMHANATLRTGRLLQPSALLRPAPYLLSPCGSFIQPSIKLVCLSSSAGAMLTGCYMKGALSRNDLPLSRCSSRTAAGCPRAQQMLQWDEAPWAGEEG